MGFSLYVPEIDAHIDDPEHPGSVFRGLEAFREHLGGALTIMLLAGIGRGIEVHEVDLSVYRQAMALLRTRKTGVRNAAENIVANTS
jgi:3-dehydroquinate synthase